MTNSYALLTSLNGLAAGLFLMSSFGLAATRQMQGCQRFYITQSICLVVSALLLGLGLHAPDLLGGGRSRLGDEAHRDSVSA